MKTRLITLGIIFICYSCVYQNDNNFERQLKGVSINFDITERFCDTIYIDTATTYQSTVAQCDSDPFTTADGSKINPNYYQKWVALSRDLICDEYRREKFPLDSNHWRGYFHFGDTIEIYSKEHQNFNGKWVIHDCMAKKYKNRIDFLLEKEKNYPKLGHGTDFKIINCYKK